MTRALACVATVVLGGVAAAQPNPDDVQRAAELYDRGKRHFDIAEYSAAVAAWKEAYLLSSEPLLLFNIAQAHRLAGDCAQANRFYLNYKRVQPRPPNQAELDSAMAKCAGVEPATGDSTPTILQPAEPGPPAKSLAPAPPAGTSPTPQTPDTVEIDEGRTLRLTGVAVASAGGVAGVIAVIYGLRAGAKADEISRQPAGTPWTPALEQIQHDGKAAETRSRIFAGLAAAGVVTGAVLYFYGRSRSSVRVDVALAPHQTEVSLSCAF